MLSNGLAIGYAGSLVESKRASGPRCGQAHPAALLPATLSSLLVRELTHRINNEFASAISQLSLAATRTESAEAKIALSQGGRPSRRLCCGAPRVAVPRAGRAMRCCGLPPPALPGDLPGSAGTQECCAGSVRMPPAAALRAMLVAGRDRERACYQRGAPRLQRQRR
jgi:hypothetical protein